MGLCGLQKISETSFFRNIKYFADYDVFAGLHGLQILYVQVP